MPERTKEELIQQIERKNQLLKRALEQLLACEWDIDMNTIIEIEDNLKLD